MGWIRRHIHFNLFLVGFVVAVLTARAMSDSPSLGRPMLIGFDIAALIFLATILRAFITSSVDELRSRANELNSDHHGLLLIGGVVLAIVMTALFSELDNGQSISILLSAGTLVLAWIFANTLFLLHYAQIYYDRSAHGDGSGLKFPDNDDDPATKFEPNAWDFAYFTFTMAIIFSVSDVMITSRRIRRIAMFHGMIAFVFNIFVIGISVGLIGDAFKEHIPKVMAKVASPARVDQSRP
ncbi:DUF1345 domain-containing protein [Polymorphobacter arshaanensis]|uniref:DUF1345 domain-containing protein n=1 Tax=Glacieibacterium arshaanense TaxID=2511025 RepID=A0A4Y9ESG8_9SPHN|nr:DUF1345 domain-containing protein [Polymorphobacter arshaanensis]TFU06547.1 DUF1345 domain-containing protein [Polymorphobacter arshaanensis]